VIRATRSKDRLTEYARLTRNGVVRSLFAKVNALTGAFD